MSGDRISPHEVRLVLALRQEPKRWQTNGELAAAAGVSDRTARLHTFRLTEIGVLEVERVFPGNRYRLVRRPAGQARGYLERVQKAREVFGV